MEVEVLDESNDRRKKNPGDNIADKETIEVVNPCRLIRKIDEFGGVKIDSKVAIKYA